MKTAQVQALSLVLITGVVLSLAGAAYFWGKPLIDKRTATTDIASAQTFILQLNDEILDVARNKGEKTLNIPALPGSVLFVNESGENSLIYQFQVTQPMLASGPNSLPVPIQTEHINPIGMHGEPPRIITIENNPSQGLYLVTLKLIYRELLTDSVPKKGYKIVLEPVSRIGKNKIIITYAGTDVETNAADNGGDLVKTIINVKIS